MSLSRITDDESLFEASDDLGLTPTSVSEFLEWDRNLYEQHKQQIRQTPDSQYSQQKPVAFNISLNEQGCQHVDLCVKEFIEDRAALSNSNISSRYHVDKVDKIYLHKDGEESLNNKASTVSLSEHLKNNVHSDERDNEFMSSNPDCDIDECMTDAEWSQFSRTSSEKSKTYSQVYNEIYEESVARQEKAEHFCKAFTNSTTNLDHCREQERISKARTQLWVKQLGRCDMDESSTETSSHSEKISEYSHKSDSKNSECIYETIMEEHLVIINRSIGGSTDCIQNLKREVDKVFLEQEGKETSNQQINQNVNSISIDEVYSVFNLQLHAERPQNNLDEIIFSCSLRNDDQEICIKSGEEICESSNVPVTSKTPNNYVKKHNFYGVDYKNEPSQESFRKKPYSRQIAYDDGVSPQSNTEILEDSSKANKSMQTESIGSSDNISELFKESSSSIVLYCREPIESKIRSNHGENQDYTDVSKGYYIKSNYSAQKSWNNIESLNTTHQSLQCIENMDLSAEDWQNNSILSKNLTMPEGSLKTENSANICPIIPKENKGSQANLSEKSSYNFGRAESNVISFNTKHSEMLEVAKHDECPESEVSIQKLNEISFSREAEVDAKLPKDQEQQEKSHIIDQWEIPICRANDPEAILAESQQSSGSCESCFIKSADQSSSFEIELPKSGHIDKNKDEEAPIEVTSFDNNVLSESQLYLNIPSSASKRWKRESDENSFQCTSENEINSLETSQDKNMRMRSRQIPRIVVYNLDTASFNIPSDFKGDAVIFDGEEDLLDVTLSDDETQIQNKLEAAMFGEKRKNNRWENNSLEFCSGEKSFSSYQPSQVFLRRTEPEDEGDEYISEEGESVSDQQHVARLAERILRSCPNYHSQRIQFDPRLERDLSDAKLFNSSRTNLHIHSIERRQDDAELKVVQQFNERLKRQVELIVQRFH